MPVGLDFETRCALDISKVGMHRYVEHPSFQVLTAGVYNGGVLLEHSYDFVVAPEDLHRFEQEVNNTPSFLAHNADFERACLRHLFPNKRVEVQDSMTLGKCLGVAAKLDDAAAQLLERTKLPEGRRLIKKFSIGDEPLRAEDVKDDPDWALFKEYCLNDARLSVMIQLYLTTINTQKRTSPVPLDVTRELQFEQLTSRMNQHGWFVDLESVREMQRQYEANLKDLTEAFHDAYDPNRNLNINSLPQLKKWCYDRGLKATSFDKDAVEKMLQAVNNRLKRPSTPPIQRPNLYAIQALLELKQELGGSSLKKLKVILERTSDDGRLRGQYMHCGAGQTRRTSGTGVQMQNLKRLSEPQDLDELPKSRWNNTVLADNLRQLFTASEPDGKLIVGDYSSIESRALAYLSGAEWKLQAYREGKDMYRVLGSTIYSLPYEAVTKHSTERKMGKLGELSCSYGASGPVVQEMAADLGLTLTLPEANKLVGDWRTVNPEVPTLWEVLEKMLKLAVNRTSVSQELGPELILSFTPEITPASLEKEHPGAQSVEMRLAYQNSVVLRRVFHGCYQRGRNICYYKPIVKNGKSWSASYRDPKTKRFKYYDLYGGKLTGILTQSFAREIFFAGLSRLNERLYGTGVEIIGQFHDEIVLNWAPTNSLWLQTTVQILEKVMSESKFTGLPLTAEVKYDYRYIK